MAIPTRVSRNSETDQWTSTPERSTSRSVIFVCQCNVCRSPAAASVLQALAKRRNLRESIVIESAGVSNGVTDLGNYYKPSLSMRWSAFKRGYAMKPRPRRLLRTELDEFDLVIAMDRSILAAIKSIHSHPKSCIKLLSDYLPCHWPQDVPDPMRRSLHCCNQVFDMLETACPMILDELYSDEQDSALASRMESPS